MPAQAGGEFARESVIFPEKPCREAPPQRESPSSGSSSGTSTAAIAGGVVGGVAGTALLVGAVVLYQRGKAHEDILHKNGQSEPLV